MKWEKKHDIILNWIDSCTSFAQLENLIKFIRLQTFDTSDLLFMVNLKSKVLMMGVYVDGIKELAYPFA